MPAEKIRNKRQTNLPSPNVLRSAPLEPEEIGTFGNRIRVVHLGTEHNAADHPLLKEFYKKVYSKAFHPDEVLSFRELRNDLKKELGHAIIALDQRGKVVGGATGEYLPGAKAGYTAYIAVHPEHRKQGVGTALTNAFRQVFAKKHPKLQWLVEETDLAKKTPFKTAYERGHPVGTILWKEKTGGWKLTHPKGGQHLQPDIDEHDKEILRKMSLHVIPFRNGAPVESFEELVERKRNEGERDYRERVRHRASFASLRLIASVYRDLAPYNETHEGKDNRRRLIKKALGLRGRIINLQGFGLVPPSSELTPKLRADYANFKKWVTRRGVTPSKRQK